MVLAQKKCTATQWGVDLLEKNGCDEKISIRRSEMAKKYPAKIEF